MTAESPADVIETPAEFAKRWLQLTSKASHLKSPLCPESYHERYADLDQRDWCCDEADLAAMVEARDAKLADPADRDEVEDLREEVAWRREASKEYGGIADKYEADLRTLRVDLATAERMSGDIEARAERAEAERDERGDRLEAMLDFMAGKEVAALDLHGDEPGLLARRVCRTCHVPQPCPTRQALTKARAGGQR